MRMIPIDLRCLLIAIALICATGTASAQAPVKPGGQVVAADMVLFDVVSESAIPFHDSFGDEGTVVVFWSNQCPWTSRYKNRLDALMTEMEAAAMQIVFVNSNDDDVFPKEQISSARANRVTRPIGMYLRDEGAKLARAFGAERTPQVFVFDKAGTLTYKGAIDDSPGDPSEAQAYYLADAVQALIQGTTLTTTETKPFGCRIKF